MAVFVKNPSAPGYDNGLEIKTDTRAMTVVTALFFMVGFLTCLNDVIIPHLKSIFELNYAEAMLVQFAFFSSYAIFSYPGGWLVDRFGYKQTMVIGLITMAVGAGGFVPASYVASFPVFLSALIILAAGMTIVQVSINPYVTVIGPSATASSRLNLAQAFNSVGTFIAPFLGAHYILHGVAQVKPEVLHSLSSAALQSYRATQASSVRLPYIGLALMLLLIALALGLIKLKTTTGVSQHTQDFRPGAFAEALTRPDTVWRHPWLLFGALGIFTYVGAEVSIGSFLVNYMGLPQVAGLREEVAANFLPVYWGGAMIGRFLGSAILQKIKTGTLLSLAAICAFVLVMLTMHTHGSGQVHPVTLFGQAIDLPLSVAMWSILAVGLFNSIMFPSIFTLGIQDLGPLTSKGSSLMIAAILGGAIIPELQGKLADHLGLQPAFIIPAICYVYIACFGIAAIRRRVASDSLIPEEF
ncbi:MAG TPA: sugar MFS transporter [Acidobacteriaceae bacterium]|nr:sugar MFS transporter [Acidobacteriaceae bacterium]